MASKSPAGTLNGTVVPLVGYTTSVEADGHFAELRLEIFNRGGSTAIAQILLSPAQCRDLAVELARLSDWIDQRRAGTGSR